MKLKIAESWGKVLKNEFEKPYFENLAKFVEAEYKLNTCYPEATKIFEAFNLCDFNNLKVVIIGQDPYHGPGQAHGLCFSVSEGVKHPPSLVNIFKEIESDLLIPLVVLTSINFLFPLRSNDKISYPSPSPNITE